MFKKLTAFLLAFTIFFGVSAINTKVLADGEPTYTDEYAKKLYDYGIFKGVGTDANGNPNFALDAMSNRAEALAMFVRLLGKEGEALASSYTLPFNDVPEWAVPYVGYAYTNKLTFGTSETTFGSDESVTERQYVTFILRALGYADSEFSGDLFSFKWGIGFTTNRDVAPYVAVYKYYDEPMTRMDISYFSYEALELYPKGRTDINLATMIGINDIAVEKGGENITYTIANDTLTISGTGAITATPWDDFNSQYSKVVIEKGITEIADGVDIFGGSVSLPEGLVKIGDEAYIETDSTGIKLPSTLTYIGSRAFTDFACDQVTIPASVRFIGEYAFVDKSSVAESYRSPLRRVIFLGNAPELGDASGRVFGRADLYFPQGAEGVNNLYFLSEVIRYAPGEDVSLNVKTDYPMYKKFPGVPDYGAMFDVECVDADYNIFDKNNYKYSYKGSLDYWDEYTEALKDLGFIEMDAGTNILGEHSTMMYKYVKDGYQVYGSLVGDFGVQIITSVKIRDPETGEYWTEKSNAIVLPD